MIFGEAPAKGLSSLILTIVPLTTFWMHTAALYLSCQRDQKHGSHENVQKLRMPPQMWHTHLCEYIPYQTRPDHTIPLHNITLHYITLRYVTLRYITHVHLFIYECLWMYNTHVMCRYAFLHCLRRWAPRLDKGSPSGINHLASTQNRQRSKRKSVKLGMSSADDDCPQYVYTHTYIYMEG